MLMLMKIYLALGILTCEFVLYLYATVYPEHYDKIEKRWNSGVNGKINSIIGMNTVILLWPIRLMKILIDIYFF